MAVDGIENVIRVLEEIENNKLQDLVFFEGAACTGGCVGGPLTFENSYVARSAIRTVMKGCDLVHPDEKVNPSYLNKYAVRADKPIFSNGAMRLDEIWGGHAQDGADGGDSPVLARVRLRQLRQPTCRTFAEDIVRGYCDKMDCIHILKDQLKIMAQKMVELARLQEVEGR